MFGPPGSGKGTQSVKISDKFGFIHISTGDMLREEINNKTEIGLELKSYIDKGELVPDETVIKMIASKINQNLSSTGFIFDGYPRTIKQAILTDEILAKNNSKINLVFSIDVDEEELIKRVTGRATTSNRTDDNITVFQNRLEVYKKMTLPLFDFYSHQKKLIRINGMLTVDGVFSILKDEIENCLLSNIQK